MRAAHFCWKKTSPTLRASSTISRSGFRNAKSEKPSRTSIPDE